jgi:hypothetical protein
VAAVARLDGGGDDWRWHVCEIDTAYMEKKFKEYDISVCGILVFDMGLDTGLNGASSV